MQLIVTNDDFAATYGFTEAVKNNCLKGITTCTSIEVNGPAFLYSAKLLKTSLRHIDLSLHLNLNHGKGYAEELIDKNGYYKYSVFHYFFLFQKPNKKFLNAIAKDLDHQFEVAFKAGLQPVCVNGHNHIHLVPPIFNIVCKLCKKYNIKYLRLPREPFYMIRPIIKNIQPFLNKNLARRLVVNYFAQQNLPTLKHYKLETTEAFYGVAYTNFMDETAIKSSILHAQKKGYKSIELLGHPALKDKRDTEFTCQFMAKYSQAKERLVEAKAFQNPKLKTFLTKHQIQLTSFKGLS